MLIIYILIAVWFFVFFAGCLYCYLASGPPDRVAYSELDHMTVGWGENAIEVRTRALAEEKAKALQEKADAKLAKREAKAAKKKD